MMYGTGIATAVAAALILMFCVMLSLPSGRNDENGIEYFSRYEGIDYERALTVMADD